MNENINKEITEFMIAVNYLIDNLEFMLEEGEFYEEKLQKRIEVVKKFKKKLDIRLVRNEL